MSFDPPQRYEKVTLIIDDGETAVKRTFHRNKFVNINGIYHVPGNSVAGIDFEISFSSEFDHNQGELFSQEILPSDIKKD